MRWSKYISNDKSDSQKKTPSTWASGLHARAQAAPAPVWIFHHHHHWGCRCTHQSARELQHIALLLQPLLCTCQCIMISANQLSKGWSTMGLATVVLQLCRETMLLSTRLGSDRALQTACRHTAKAPL